MRRSGSGAGGWEGVIEVANCEVHKKFLVVWRGEIVIFDHIFIQGASAFQHR